MELITAPSEALDYNKSTKLFLAGTIDNGAAREWQNEVIEGLKNEDVMIFNPRRYDWDFSTKQDISNDYFYDQVCWELNHLRSSDIIIFNFEPNSKSIVTMLEYGLITGLNAGVGEIYEGFNNTSIILCCPNGFHKKGNIDVVTGFFDLKDLLQVDTIDEMVKVAKVKIKEYNDNPECRKVFEE